MSSQPVITIRRRLGIALILALMCATAAFAGTAQAAGGGKKTFSNNTPVPIPDEVIIPGDVNPGGTISPMFVTGLTGTITKVTASLNIEYDPLDDLYIALAAPFEEPDFPVFSWLAQQRPGTMFGTSCDEADRTTFDDDAATFIEDGTAPYVGSFKPQAAVEFPLPLSVFNGLTAAEMNGEWGLNIFDVGLGGSGFLYCWSLTITTTDGTTTFNNEDITEISEASEGAPSGGPGEASSPVTVSGMTGWISEVTVTLWVTHTRDSDLDLTVESPGGTRVALARAAGGNGDNFGTSCTKRTAFADSAKNALAQGEAPFVGTFRPQSPLAKFNGLTGGDVNGQWNLIAADNHLNNTGVIECWSLTVTTSNTPVPTTPDLGVSVALAWPRFLPGTNNFAYFNITNNTADQMTDVALTSNLPGALSQVSAATFYTPQCSNTGQQLNCAWATLDPGGLVQGIARVFIAKNGKFCIEGMASATGVAASTAKTCFESTSYVKGDKGDGYTIGSIAHDFTLQDQNGNSVSLSQFKGKFVLLQWSTVWCGPSQIEVPQDRDEVKALNDDNVMGEEVVYLQVLLDGPTANVRSTQANAQNWVAEMNLTTPVLFNANDSNYISYQQHATYSITGGGTEVHAVPVSVFIDPAGTIFDLRVGVGPEGDTTDRFEAYLN